MFQHTIDVAADFRVRESYCREPTQFVDPVPDCILRRIMRVAVEFDDQRLLRAEEVSDAIANDVLPSKPIATELRPTDVPPKLCFERREVLPKTLCSIEKMCVLLQRRTPPLPLP
jgi:hypothetical protein